MAPSGWPCLLQIVRKQFNVSKDCEITVECNPDSADQDTLLTLKKAESTACLWGYNPRRTRNWRKSAGYTALLRPPRPFQRARDAGFDNISLDLIYGLPDQTMESWKESVEALLKLNPGASVLLWAEAGAGDAPLRAPEQEQMADDDTQADMYLWMVERLKNA